MGLAREQEPRECVVCGAPAEALWQRVVAESGAVAYCCCEGHARVWLDNEDGPGGEAA